MPSNEPNYLHRLPAEYYRGRAYVHWSMTTDDRKTGWLDQTLHFEFREVLTHTAFRYGLCCPIYCCMPDHFHLLWLGILEASDQRIAARFLRRHLNLRLGRRGIRLQKQPYDHVLCDEERQEAAFAVVVEYLARNPERAGLVAPDHFREYLYTGCLVPGYPDLSPWQQGYWDRFWRIYSRLCARGLTVTSDEEQSPDNATIGPS